MGFVPEVKYLVSCILYFVSCKVYKHKDTYDTKCNICDNNEIGKEFYYQSIFSVFIKVIAK